MDISVQQQDYNKEILKNSEIELGIIIETEKENVFGDYNIMIDNETLENDQTEKTDTDEKEKTEEIAKNQKYKITENVKMNKL